MDPSQRPELHRPPNPAPELKVWLTEQPSADDQPASVYEQTFVQENGFKVMMVTYEAE